MASFAQVTASGLATQGLSKYCGYQVAVVTAVGAINVRSGSITGTIIDLLPAATAAGASRNLAQPIFVPNGIFVEFNGGATGTVTILFE